MHAWKCARACNFIPAKNGTMARRGGETAEAIRWLEGDEVLDPIASRAMLRGADAGRAWCLALGERSATAAVALLLSLFAAATSTLSSARDPYEK